MIMKIEEFIQRTKLDPKDIPNALKREIDPEEGEYNSWVCSLSALANVLNDLQDELKRSCEIVLEAGYRSPERADAVIIGKNAQGEAVAIMIENKQWSDVAHYIPVGEGNESVIDPYHNNQFTAHPCHEVSHYKYILDNTNGYVQDNNVSVYTAVFMHNATEDERTQGVGPFNAIFETAMMENPVFVGEQGTNVVLNRNLCQYIADRITQGKAGLAESIYSSERKESDEYKVGIANLFGNREALIRYLDENQLAIFEEIRTCINENLDHKTVFIVEGEPGTGKTFVAEALIAYLYQRPGDNGQTNIKLILKNRDPRRALQRMGMPKLALTHGLKGDNTNYDALICDESHRMLEKVWRRQDDRDNIEVIIRQSRVSVFFYDSKQRVHINDYVTKERIEEKARQLGIANEDIITRRLRYQHRCMESDHFMKLIDRILYEPERGLEGVGQFREDEVYKVYLIDDPKELFYKIKTLEEARDNDAHHNRVLAGKGRTDGVDWRWDRGNDNLPIQQRLTVGPLRDGNRYVWNLHEYPPLQSFASDDASVNLVGCLDTCQGLDFEYVGLILSPDIIYDEVNRMVVINPDGHQREDPNLNIADPRQNMELMKTLIRNTYRVLASRGEKGCFIYCCDENLQRYLGTVIPTLHVEVPDDYMVYPLGEERQAAEDVGMHGRVANVYDRGTAQIRDDAGKTYGVSVRNGRGLHVGDEVSFVPSPDGRYANNVVVINM